MTVRLCRWLGLLLAVGGAAGWAVAAGLLPAAARRSEEAARTAPASGLEGGYYAPDEWVNWVHDLRWAALVVIVCGLGLASPAGRRRALAVPAGAGLVLVVANALLTGSPGGRGTALGTLGFAILVIGAAALVLSPARPSAPTGVADRVRPPRSHLLIYAMLAGVVAPLPAVNSNTWAARFLVADEIVVTVAVLAALLAIMAVCCALGAAPALSPRRVLAGALLVLAWGSALVVAGSQAMTQVWVMWTLLGGGVPLVALFAIAVAPSALRRPPKGWVWAGVAVVIGYPCCAYLALASGVGFIGLVISGGQASVDGIPVVTAGIMLGILAGILAEALSTPGDLALDDSPTTLPAPR